MLLFLLGLRFLRIFSLNRWVLAFIYWFTFFSICEIYAYIPIRSFIPHGDIYHFVSALNISPWIVAIPGTLFAFWGFYYILFQKTPQILAKLKIHTKIGRCTFLFVTIYLFFGYYGAVGFLEPYPIAQKLSLISFTLIPFVCFYCWLQRDKFMPIKN